ncbi:MAG: hypothetical protein RLZZ511_841 [Cyanobacteriota bacterium]|jgi:hypothetical protein
MMNVQLNGQQDTRFTMSLRELEVALEAALSFAKSMSQASGMDSKDYFRAWRTVEEVKAEIAARCGQSSGVQQFC